MNTSQQIRLFYITSMIHIFGMSTILVAYTPFLRSQGLSFTETLGMNVIFHLTIIPFELFFGVLADALGKKKVVLSGFACFGLSNIIYALSSSFLTFVIAEVTGALGVAAVSGAFQAIALHGLNKEKRTHIISQHKSLILITRIPAALIGGVMSNSLGFQSTFWFFALTCFITFILTIFMPEDNERSQFKSLLKDVNTIFRSRSVSGILPYILVYSAVNKVFFSYWIILLGENGNVSQDILGIIAAVYMMAMVLGNEINKRFQLKLNPVRNLSMLGLVYLLVFPGFFLGNVWVIVVIFFIAEALIGMSEIQNTHWFDSHTSDNNRSSIMSGFSVINVASSALGLILGGILGDLLSPITTFAIMGCICLMTSAVYLKFER